MLNTRINTDLSLRRSTKSDIEHATAVKKIDLSKIKIEWLNKRSLVLISIFSHVAYKQEKVTIDLQSPNVLQKVSCLVKKCNNQELKELYKKIKTQIKLSMVEASLSAEIAQQVDDASVTQP